ncbi:MAG: hypothetical protein K0V04_39555 [Deltaproteobacteria bacterium]|nr:hypothetical protein [Deltaproteobacteria bacterium]
MDSPEPIDKMRTALQLADLALRVMRQNLRRRHPDESPDEIESRLRTWVQTRPGADHGDCIGRPIELDLR